MQNAERYLSISRNNYLKYQAYKLPYTQKRPLSV